MEGNINETVDQIAKETEGFSGREIMKMVVAWHDAAFTLDDAVLTPEVMMRVLHKFHLQHKLKKTWTRDESLIFEKMFVLDEEMTGTAKEEGPKDEEMLRAQESIVDEIEKDRLELKHMRQEANKKD